MTQATPDTEEDPFRGALRDGETLGDAFHIGDATVGVTDHRLLVRQDGHTRAVDLTNVGAIQQHTVTDSDPLYAALQWAVVAVVLLGGWLFAPLDSLQVEVEAPPGTGFEDLFRAIARLIDILAYLDEAFLLGGLVAFAVVGWQLFAYLRGREEVLEVTVAGMDPIRLPPARDPTAVDRLRGAVNARADAATVSE